MPLHFDPKTTALVLIDVQQGTLGMQLLPHPAARIVENSTALATRFIAAGAPVVLVSVAFASDSADRLRQPVDAPTVLPSPPGGIPAAWSELAAPLAILPGTIRITKRQWGAFFGTELDLQLRRRGVATIVLGGIATNFGVESTAREAWQHNYALIVAEDCCASVSDEMHAFSISKILPRLAKIRSTGEILAAMAAG